MNTKTKESYECRVDATVSKYKGSGEFLFMKLDGKFHWKFCFKPSLVKRTIIVLLWVLILMVYSTFRVYSISLSTFNHDKKYHWPFNIVKTPQAPPPPLTTAFIFLTWSEFQQVSSFLSNMYFFPYWLESRFKTELTLEKGKLIKIY